MTQPFTTKDFPIGVQNALQELDKYREKQHEAMLGVSDYGYGINPYQPGLQQNGWSQSRLDERMRAAQEAQNRLIREKMEMNRAPPKPEGARLVEDYHKKRRGLLILMEGL